MYKSVSDIRQEFLNFFKNKNHQIVESSSLIPDHDQTLLFTNSGMNQFKDIFLGIDKPLFKRVVTVQRCMRAGGKHNDLNNVGYTERHLTFFEMLGNFSFGDYFKCEAIQFAWELLTDLNWFNLSKDRIWVTVHACDNESYNIWSRIIGVSDQHIIKIGSNGKNGIFAINSNNFWQMGNIGPCGPCSEIFYDRGSDIQGGPPGSTEEHGERYVEIWNLVFIQFNRQINGDLLSLPMISIDTGMGLERIASILQGVHSNYAIDIFKNLISSICRIIKVKNCNINRSVYVIADHIRACTVLIGDGVMPDNEGRGYVLRRIIRRAILHGKKLGINSDFFYKLVFPFIKSTDYITDLLCEKEDFIAEVVLNEEKLFKETLSKGLELLEKQLLLSGDILNGEIVFDLYTTYGFPFELTKDICLERNIKFDQIGFDKLMLEQKKYNRKVNQCYRSHDQISSCDMLKSTFVGYQILECQSRIVELFQDNKIVNIISATDDGVVILKETPFYGESGGQIGDSGELKTEYSSFQVMYTKKHGRIIKHFGVMRNGVFRVGDVITAKVDKYKRQRICFNHSAHHLLRAALFKTLGEHVIQKGSLVNDRYLRFDFSHHTMMTEKQINVVEDLVNQNIWKNFPITVDLMSIEKARDLGVIMLSDQRYGNKRVLRVINIGKFSVELCGGTHVNSTGEIGLFIITKECSVAAGIRRIEGITGDTALYFSRQQKKLITNISTLMCCDEKYLLNKIREFKYNYHKLEKEIILLQNKQMVQLSISVMKEIFFIKDVQILIRKFINMELKVLFNMIDYFKSKLSSGVIIFFNCKNNNRIHLIVGVTKNLIEHNRINALNIVRDLINIFGGKGGGRFDFAQAGINEIKDISAFTSAINSLLRGIL